MMGHSMGPRGLRELRCHVFWLQVGHGIDTPNLVSIATGLSPPFTGQIAFDHVRKFCKGILLVSEDELKATVMFSYEHGLVVEASGAAALAALLHGKVTLNGLT